MRRLSIPMAEHERAMQDQAHAYEIKLDALRLELAKSRAVAPAVNEQVSTPAAASNAQPQKRR